MIWSLVLAAVGKSAALLRKLQVGGVGVPQQTLDRLDAGWKATGRDKDQEEMDFWQHITDTKEGK